jgi:hypothetical protein
MSFLDIYPTCGGFYRRRQRRVCAGRGCRHAGDKATPLIIVHRPLRMGYMGYCWALWGTYHIFDVILQTPVTQPQLYVSEYIISYRIYYYRIQCRTLAPFLLPTTHSLPDLHRPPCV